MAAPGNDRGSNSTDYSEDPPPLSITLKMVGDLPNKMERLSTDHLPVDILLLTVEDCEYLACHHYLRDPFKSFEKSIGCIYVGKMGEDDNGALKVALVKCSEGSSDPGGSQTLAKNAVELLKPKATVLVGVCYSPSPEKAQIGDVVISSKLTTNCYRTPVSRYIGNLVRSAAEGWKAPLKNPEAREVKVHCNGEILSCSDLISAKQQCQFYPNAIAVEMEGKGMFAAAHDMKMEWVVVKGVHDFIHGSGSTNDLWKTFACVMAASVVSNMLSNSFVFEDWPHYREGELNIKVEVEDLKVKEPNMQTTTIATETDGCQRVQYQRAAASSPTEGSLSPSGTEDLQTIKTRVLASIADNYLRETPPRSIEDHRRFEKHMRKMSVSITGVSVGSLLITVKCDSLQILEQLWTYYSSGHLGEMVQNCFVTKKILEEMNLAELKLKTTMDRKEYIARKVDFERDPPRGKRKRRRSPCHSNRDPKKPKVTSVDMAVKQGSPTNDELQELGDEIGEKWMQLGRRLRVKEPRLQDIDQRHRQLCEKGYNMLMAWKQEYGSESTYQTLGVALQQKPVKRKDLAEKICYQCDISVSEESCDIDDSSHKRLKFEEPLNVEKCREQLRSHYDTLCKVKTVPWDNSSSIEIDEMYTPLSWFRDERTLSGVTQEQLEDYTDMFKGNKHHPEPTRMLVYGRLGIGKSTFCKKIAYDWMKGSKKILLSFYILLVIKLRDVCYMENIRDVLCASKLLASDGPISVDSLYDYMRKTQDKVLLILDGYDEYSYAKENSPILEIWRGEQLRDIDVIITTRQLECDELASPSHVQFRIHGFSWPQIKAYAGKHLTSEQDVESFTAYLMKNKLKDLAEIPLLLLMLCLLWKEKHNEGLPTARADIYTEFIQTMLNHKVERAKSKRFQEVSSKEAREDLSILGKVAFDALLQGRLFARCNELPDSISRTLENLREVGLFQIVNIKGLNPEKGAYFIHKSIQEFLAAWHMKEEVLSMNGDWITSLSRLESMEKILKSIEVLKFVCELSKDAPSAVFHHVVAVEKMGPWLDSESSKLTQSTGKLRLEKELCTTLVSHSYFCCSPEKRRDLFSKFLSHTKGIMRLDSSQVNIVAKEHLLKSAEAPKYIFFPDLYRYSDQSYRDLITVAEDVKAVVVSSSGEKKASDFLRRHAGWPLMNFFFRKKRKIILYLCRIVTGDGEEPFPTKMLRELMSSKAESTQKKRVGDRLNEHDKETATCSTENTDSITGPIPQSLSRLKDIFVSNIGRQEVEMLIDILPLFSSLTMLGIRNVSGIVDAQLMEALVSSIKYGKRLLILNLGDANLTSEPAAAIARSLHQAPNLITLDLSNNSLGKGVSVLTRHLSSCPDLNSLFLDDVKMTKEQIKDLSRAVRQSNISEVCTAYHDEKGNVKPEDEWRTWDGIEIGLATDSEDEHESGSSTDSEDKQESWSVTDSKDEEESDSINILEEEQEAGVWVPLWETCLTDSEDDEESALLSGSGDEQEPAS